MLKEIKMNNFKSFMNSTTIDLKKTNYTILPNNVAENGILKGCAFVGANASGKSNIILSIKLFLDFMFRERGINSGMFKCLFSQSSQYSIEYTFLIDDKDVKYRFEIDIAKKFISENLYMDDVLLMERIGDSAKSYITDKNGICYDSSDVGKDSLFLRTLYFNTKFSGNTTLQNWMEYLKNSVYINLYDKIIQSYSGENYEISTYLKENGSELINDFFDKYSFEQNVEYTQASEGFNYTIMVLDEKKTIFFKRKGINEPIPFIEESLGNQNLLNILPAFLNAIKNNGLLLIDEFSSGFHNELEELLVKHFMNTAKNAQLIFVTHSTNLLSNSILRPDQEYAVSFKSEIGSVINRFSNEQPRIAQNIEKMYNSGIFGGLPNYNEI